MCLAQYHAIDTATANNVEVKARNNPCIRAISILMWSLRRIWIAPSGEKLLQVVDRYHILIVPSLQSRKLIHCSRAEYPLPFTLC